MKVAIEKANAVGSSCIAVRNSHHFGAAGYYASLALEHDMIGLALSNAGPAVLPTFGLQPQLGTNPIALAVPSNKEPPFVLDMATSVKAAGKLRLLIREGKEAPVGWLMSADGKAARSPEGFFRGITTGISGGLLPLGGAGEETSGYKGYGLGLAVELLTLLAGDTPGPFMKIRPDGPEPNISFFFKAIRVDAFRPARDFKADVDRILAHIKTSPKMPGQHRIYVAGEKAFERHQERRANGIPLDPSVVDDLENLAQDFGFPAPKPGAPPRATTGESVLC
jgi:LDH2 family malate/lactate/ureidoglycolate dehydrogenase